MPVFWQRWLVAVTAGVLVFGLAIVLVPYVSGELFNLVVFGTTEHPSSFSAEAIDYQRFVWGVLGATMAGWAVALLALLTGPFRRREHWAWRAVTGSLTLWYVVDTAFSLTAGFPENAIFNTVIALAYAPALVATRPGTSDGG